MPLEERVLSVIKKITQKNVQLHSKLVEDLGVDSFDKLMIISGLEDEFNVNVDDEDFVDVITISDIVGKFQKYEEGT